MGDFALQKPKENGVVSGVLVKRNFNCHIISPRELGKYSDLTVSTINQRTSIQYDGSWQLLHYLLSSMYGNVEVVLPEGSESKCMRVFDSISVMHEPPVVVLEWMASPTSDMYADAIMKVILKASDLNSTSDLALPAVAVTSIDKMHFKECLIELLQEMFGEDSIPKIFKGERLYVTVNDVKAFIDLGSMNVSCESEKLQRIVQTAVSKLHDSLCPVTSSLK
ncbi:Cleavage and polyadenylation specificity factor subunit 3 [Halocaridina rubra]|uniref:Cleavage and polyadenylation specificity factor subunit 3 n=1 Tax=Halocaridina rubra TaxID=373956 RepID=A0AAN8XAZ4_HALRR